MTTHIVADDTLGTISRRMWEVQRRLLEGTLDPSFVARNLQLTAEGTQVPSIPSLVTTSPFFANEEVASSYGYPQWYTVKPICEQLVALAKHFPGLNASPVLACSKELPGLPQGAEGWFAVPKFEKVAKTYNEAVEKVLDLIGKTRTFSNYRKGNLGEKYLKLSERTAVALQMLGEKQQGDFLLIPAQFGLAWRGWSVRKVRYNYVLNEFGLGSFIVGSMLLSHPERLVQWEQLHIDCPGDEHSSGADGQFDRAPVFLFYGGKADGQFGRAPVFLFFGGKVEFLADWTGSAYEHCGSASGFLSQ